MLGAYNLTKNQVKRCERVMKRGQIQFNIYMAPELIVDMAYQMLYSVESVKETEAVCQFLLSLGESMDEIRWRILTRVHSNYWIPNMLNVD